MNVKELLSGTVAHFQSHSEHEHGMSMFKGKKENKALFHFKKMTIYFLTFKMKIQIQNLSAS